MHQRLITDLMLDRSRRLRQAAAPSPLGLLLVQAGGRELGAAGVRQAALIRRLHHSAELQRHRTRRPPVGHSARPLPEVRRVCRVAAAAEQLQRVGVPLSQVPPSASGGRGEGSLPRKHPRGEAAAVQEHHCRGDGGGEVLPGGQRVGRRQGAGGVER